MLGSSVHVICDKRIDSMVFTSYDLQLDICGVLVIFIYGVSRVDITMGGVLMEWILKRKQLPMKVQAYEVTLEDRDGGRVWNVAVFRPENSTWDMLLDQDDFRDMKVIAWREMSEPYEGKA